MRAFASVKQPQTRHRNPVWCSQVRQVAWRASRTSAGVVFNPEATNAAIARVAEIAILSRPGPAGGPPGPVRAC
jgi:hypothetical protein